MCIVKRKMDRNPKTNGQIELEKRQQILDGVYIGSDEVGTGDYFGPIVVTASFVSKENIPLFITSVDKLDKMTREDVEKELINHTDKKIIDKEIFDLKVDDTEKIIEELGIDTTTSLGKSKINIVRLFSENNIIIRDNFN